MRTLIVPLVAALLTTGCGLVYKQPIYQGNLVSGANVEQLQPGMSRQQVMALLGSPSVQDPFHHDRWDYTASQRLGRGGDTEVRNLVLHFEGDTLARWEGDHFPDRDKELIEDVRQQFGPNLQRQNNQRRRNR